MFMSPFLLLLPSLAVLQCRRMTPAWMGGHAARFACCRRCRFRCFRRYGSSLVAVVYHELSLGRVSYTKRVDGMLGVEFVCLHQA